MSSELRLTGACTQAQADQVLSGYLPRHNRRFTVPAQDPVKAWIAWPNGRHLDDVFCYKYRRVVGNDNTVRFDGDVIDIPPSRHRPTYAHARVEVQEQFDGTLRVYHEGHCIGSNRRTRPITYRIQPQSLVRDELPPVTLSTPRRPPRTEPWRPPSNHPWRTPGARTSDKVFEPFGRHYH